MTDLLVLYHLYFWEEEIKMKISTISIAEYCVKGDITDLPLKNLMILPFQLRSRTKAGEFAKTIYEIRNKAQLAIIPKILIPNDTKLFAQADVESSINAYVSSDAEFAKIYAILKSHCGARFDFTNINIPVNQQFELLF
ncbi:MAG: hypothetical protein ACLR8Y_10915 [Alistipes indistinctus]